MDKQVETIRIDGMSCGHCVAAVRRALSEVEGVEVGDVTIGTAEIAYAPGTVDRAEIERAIDDAGFSISAA